MVENSNVNIPPDVDRIQQIKNASDARIRYVIKLFQTEAELRNDTEFIEKFTNWKTEVDSDVKDIVTRIDALKKKLEENLFDDEGTKTSYLSGNKDDYFACLQLDTQKLKDLFQFDLNHWNSKKKATETKMSEIQKKIKALQTEFLCPELAKLPTFGEAIEEGKHDFEWPKKFHLDRMENPYDVKLQKIDIWYSKSHPCVIRKIRVTLSNGVSSPWYMAILSGTEEIMHTMTFNPNIQYRNYSVADDVYNHFKEYEYACINGLYFSDQNNRNQLSWMRYNGAEWEGLQEVPADQEIIGIYGVSQVYDRISTLGFITKSNAT